MQKSLKPRLKRRRKKSLDSKQLVDTLSRSIVAIEATLFRQASVECRRLDGLSKVMQELEVRIFDPDVIEELTQEQKVLLYREARKSQENIINYLYKLHNLSLDTQAILTYLDQLEKQREKVDLKEDGVIDSKQAKEVKKVILDLIKRKKSEEA